MSFVALEFLRQIAPLYGDGLINLVAIDPATDEPKGEAFRPDDESGMVRFLEAHAAKNLYFGQNALHRQPKKGKATKADVGHMLMLSADFDPRSPTTQEADMAAHRARLAAFPLKPSAVMDTGRGMQAFWFLREPVYLNGNLTDLERYTKQLAKGYFKADSTFNIDRVMRLPGTTNWLSPTKREKGFTGARPTRLIECDVERRYALSDFDFIFQESPPPADRTSSPAQPRQEDKDWSVDLMKHVRGMVFDDETDEAIHAAFAEHPHVVTQSDPRRAIDRCIKLARDNLAAMGDCAGVHPGAVRELRDAPADLFILPNAYVPVPIAARRIFAHMGRRRELFTRGGRAVELGPDGTLQLVGATEFRSRLDGERRRVKHFVADGRGELVLKYQRCSQDRAAVMLASKEMRDCLPPIALVARAPVLVEHEGKLLALGRGYHEVAGGVMVRAGSQPPDVTVTEAVNELLGLVADYQFTTPADRGRAVAGLIGPCLRMGMFVPGHALIDCKEADKSQAGKGHMLALTRAIYGESAHLVTKRNGGVGSLDESLATALVSGQPFVQIDNVRGKLDSEYLEAVLTSHDPVPARIPHKGEVAIDARRVVFQLTSNGIESTQDLANRMLITRLLKQPAGYEFRSFPEGDILAHVRARQSYYAACVFAVVRHWHAAGKPTLPTAHTFREWVGTLDWIVQRVFALPPLFDGHDGILSHVTSPGLAWLRSVALVAVKDFPDGRALTATTLVELAEAHDLAVPSARPDLPEDAAARLVGKLLASAFKRLGAPTVGQLDNGKVHVDDFAIDAVRVRRVFRGAYDAQNRKPRVLKAYQFWLDGGDPPDVEAARDDEL